MVQPYWPHQPISFYYAKAYKKEWYNIQLYKDGKFHTYEKFRIDYDCVEIYTLLPMYKTLQQRMLTRILQQITGDETFECNYLEEIVPDVLTMRF
jgi:type IV secretory pathway VirB9-like protein